MTESTMVIRFEAQLQFLPIDISGLNGTGNPRHFHPMKGPMTTQTLRGLTNSGAMHWRGDRSTGFFGTSGVDETISFKNFVVAFPGLLGAIGMPSEAEMDAFTNFALQVTLPPNPVRALDNSLTPSQQNGLDFFDGTLGQFSDGAPILVAFTCQECHAHDAEQGFFGTGREASFENEPQIFKIPHFRNLYQKVGMFGTPNVPFLLNGDNGHKGDQVRGTGFIHDGSIDTVFRFFRATVFDNPGILDGSPLVGFNGGDPQRRDMEELMLAFDSDLAPIVGQQITLDENNIAEVGSRLDLLEQRAETPFVSAILGGAAANTNECDLVAKGRWNNRLRSALYMEVGGVWGYRRDTIDTGAEPLLTPAEMRAIAQTTGQATTFTCVPPGSGVRVGLDRDGDGVWNRDEANSSTQPDNPGSITGACSDGIDNDGDGDIDLGDVGCAAAGANIENPQCSDGYDNDGDGLADLSDPDCTSASSNRELALPVDDCRAGPTSATHGAGFAALLLMALALGTRRRRTS